MIKSATEVDATLAQGKAAEARIRQAEGRAYYRVIEPLIANGNTTTAQTLAGIFDLASKQATGSAAKVTAALSSAYGPLRISPSDIGQLATGVDGAQTDDASGAQDGEPDDGEPEDGE